MGIVAAILSAYSLGCGVTAVMAMLGVFCLFKLKRLKGRSDETKRRELAQLLVVTLSVIVGIAVWFVGYQMSATGRLSLLLNFSFWSYFVNLVSFGFGCETLSALLGICFLSFVLVPLIGESWKQKGQMSNQLWMLNAAVVGVLAALLLIAIGRFTPDMESSKQSRYAEIGLMLVPLSLLAWSLFLQQRPQWTRAVIGGLWMICFLTFLDDWKLFSMYEMRFREKMAGLVCLSDYYERGERGFCPTIYPMAPITSQLEEAKRLDLSFYRKIRRQHTEPELQQP